MPETLSFDISTIKNVPQMKAKDQCSFLNRARIVNNPGARSCAEHHSGQEKLLKKFLSNLNNVPRYNAFKQCVERFLSTECELRPVGKNWGSAWSP